MKTATIEDLAYLMRQARIENVQKPIFFIGAGASKSGGIPLSGEIVKDISEKFADNPKIRSLNDKDKNYSNLMECLTPFERNTFLKEYVDNANINASHIYLAQLFDQEYVDYILTVNFDNLLLRALALFNNFPTVYDLSVLKNSNTFNLKEKSLIYLHGQHHDPWLINEKKELDKADEVIPLILNSIKNQRPWVFIGYSGEDPIFDHIAKLGPFNHGLYWVTHNHYNTNVKVYKELVEKNKLNAYVINGYDADSFMLKLNAKLKLPQPLIFDKPFTSLKKTLSNILDIDNNDYFKGVKERLEIAKRNVEAAIQRFESGKVISVEHDVAAMENDLLKKQIIDLIIKGEFNQEEIYSIEESAKLLNNEEVKKLMAGLFNYWGIVISNLAKQKNDEALFEQGIEKFKKGTELNPENDSAYYNWGSTIFDLAKLRNDEALFEQSFEKYKKATELNPERRGKFSYL